MKRLFAALAIFVLAVVLIGCSRDSEATVFDSIKLSPAARLELTDGSSVYVDGEIASLRTFADMNLAAAPLEPADGEGDWLYRIVFNPDEKVANSDEIVVSFHEKYVQIGSEYYLASEGVEFEGILQWAESKFDYFFENAGTSK